MAYSHNFGPFMLTKPIDGNPATVLNGGTSVEDAYLAYLRDPDGHNLLGLARPAG